MLIQIERLKLDKEEYYLDYLDLQQRIDKAIEYIKENCEIIHYDKENIDKMGKVESIPLLSILED